MNFRKVKEIVKFDVHRSIQNKWFVILNVLMFIAILLMTNWSNISEYLNEHNINILETDQVTIQIVDNEDLIFDSFVENYGSYDNLKFEMLNENPYSKDNIPDDNVILVEVSSSETEYIIAKVVSKEGIDSDIQTIIYNEIKEAKTRIFAERNNISLDEIEVLNEEPSIELELLGVDAENSETKEIIQVATIFIVYMVLLFILARIANEIVQEKMSKSIEYVLTCVTAKEYLLAKVLSITLATLIQILYTFVYYIIGNCISSLFIMQDAVSFSTVFSNIDLDIVSYVLALAVYLIFTVFLIALIQATLSSKTSSVSEAGNTTFILIFVMIALYMISLFAISPYITVTPAMYIISCLPIVSTFFVPAMMIIGQATTAQIIISFVVLIATAPAIFGVCSKYFKNGILDYTNSNKKPKNKKELSIEEKQEHDLKSSIAKRFGFNIGIAFIILIFLEMFLSYILGLILPNILNVDSQTLSIVLNGLVSLISLMFASWFIISNSEEKETEKTTLNSKQIFENTFTGIAIIGILQIVLTYIYSKIGLDYDIFEEYSVVPSATIFSNIAYFITMAIIPPLVEELFFRKAILNYSKKYGNAFAILFSSLLFGLFHMNLNQGIFAFLIGILFGVIAVKTSSIKITVLLHFLNNTYAALQVMASGVTYDIVNNIFIAIFIFSIIILIKNLPKIKNCKKENFKINKDCLMIFRNYTFILSLILLVVMFVVTENLLQI